MTRVKRLLYLQYASLITLALGIGSTVLEIFIPSFRAYTGIGVALALVSMSILLLSVRTIIGWDGEIEQPGKVILGSVGSLVLAILIGYGLGMLASWEGLGAIAVFDSICTIGLPIISLGSLIVTRKYGR